MDYYYNIAYTEKYFIYLFTFGCAVSLLQCRGFLCGAGGRMVLSPVVVCGLLVVLASLVVQHRL